MCMCVSRAQELTWAGYHGRPVGRNKRTPTHREAKRGTHARRQHDHHPSSALDATFPLTRCKWGYGAWGMPPLAVGTDRAPPHTVSCSTFGWEGIRYSHIVDSATLLCGGRRPGLGEARSTGLSACASHTCCSKEEGRI